MKLASQVLRTGKPSSWGSVYLQGLCLFLWAAAVLLLPITSLPQLVHMSGASTVAPPSNVLFLSLAVIWLIPYLISGKKIPAEGKPLLVFGLVILISWLAAFFIFVPSFKDQSIFTKGPNAFITLLMGLGAYFVSASWLASNRKHMRLTLQLIHLSGLVLLVWTFVQVVYVFFHGSIYPLEIVRIQQLISSRPDPLYAARVTGMAYEPSWFAHQLNLLYLPLWLSATVQGHSAFQLRLWRFSLENFLLIAGVFSLFVSFSRVGLLSFFFVVAYIAIIANLHLAQKLHWKLTPYIKVRVSLQKVTRGLLTVILVVGFLAIYLTAIVGLLKLGSRFEPRLERFFDDPFSAGSLYEVTNQLAFAERVIYWATGWEIFNDHPFLGVGLGNAGFFFPEKMPAFGYSLTEVSVLFNHQEFLPNTKSMWVRILAETGLVGFAVFLSWNYLLWQSGRLARYGEDSVTKTVGLAGQLVLIGFIIEGFSVDSFALPYFWFSVGLLSAAAYHSRQDASRLSENKGKAYG